MTPLLGLVLFIAGMIVWVYGVLMPLTWLWQHKLMPLLWRLRFHEELYGDDRTD